MYKQNGGGLISGEESHIRSVEAYNTAVSKAVRGVSIVEMWDAASWF